VLKVRRQEIDEVHAQAGHQYPEECCGILLGTRNGDVCEVHQVRLCANVATDTTRRYEISPVEAVAVQRTARALGLEIIGFYHSHPNHPAVPSQTDVELAAWPDCSYVIASVRDGSVREVRSWVWAGDEFREETIEIVQEQ
jgi:proteasome lid subunit RPN8/RPN11